MKNVQWLLLVLFLLASFSCTSSEANLGSSGPEADADTSYAFGLSVGQSLEQTGVSLDYKALVDGIKAGMAKDFTVMTEEKAMELIEASISKAEEAKAVVAEQEETKFLEENKAKVGIKVTESGVQYEVITEGSGAKPQATDVVQVHYIATLVSGEEFDNSRERGEPAELSLDSVIPGWAEAVQLMSVGARYRVWIPSALAYGAAGAGGVIPPYATVIFDIELLGIGATE